MEDVQPATLFDPTPQRYAIHKLLIIGERAGQFRAKVGKDLAQVASLLDYFNMADPDAIKEAWTDALSRGPGWRKRAF